jgi:hypothetical protein
MTWYLADGYKNTAWTEAWWLKGFYKSAIPWCSLPDIAGATYRVADLHVVATCEVDQS